ncbi:UNVERIFIED_CONTAM: hypothetical protein Scaly_2201600 [Sesamum calycinum]|uniref:Uncharacterized protein n=1 Tax=Sesamum calycinum TaxID=2727403 RepID=A0AAW2MPL3_9LAMI
MSSSSSTLTATQKYAAGALFALALHQAQLHQTHPLGFPSHDDDDGGGDPSEERVSTSSSSDAVSDDPQLWVHQSAGLLRPVFKYQTFFSLLDCVFLCKYMRNSCCRCYVFEHGKSPDDYKSKKEKQHEYENACREKFAPPDKKLESKSKEGNTPNDRRQEINAITSIVEEAPVESMKESDGKPLEEVTMLSYPRKLTVLYELLSACLADTPEDNKKSTRGRKGYDARHRVALRLLATWFDVKWKKMNDETMQPLDTSAYEKGNLMNLGYSLPYVCTYKDVYAVDLSEGIFCSFLKSPGHSSGRKSRIDIELKALPE